MLDTETRVFIFLRRREYFTGVSSCHLPPVSRIHGSPNKRGGLTPAAYSRPTQRRILRGRGARGESGERHDAGSARPARQRGPPSIQTKPPLRISSGPSFLPLLKPKPIHLLLPLHAGHVARAPHLLFSSLPRQPPPLPLSLSLSLSIPKSPPHRDGAGGGCGRDGGGGGGGGEAAGWRRIWGRRAPPGGEAVVRAALVRWERGGSEGAPRVRRHVRD